LPLKEEHKLFLVRTLIPLHKPRSFLTYHQQLSNCIIQFLEKDCKLADTVIRGLVKFWPVTNSPKEVVFLEELQEILEATQLVEFQRCMVSLFHQIDRCLTSSQFQVNIGHNILNECSLYATIFPVSFYLNHCLLIPLVKFGIDKPFFIITVQQLLCVKIKN
jgi:hypothetical protein